MSETAPSIDASEQAARIARMQEETRKFVAEGHKLAAEQAKLAAEQAKLYAEALKLRRDHWLAPLALLLAGVGGIAGGLAATVTVLKALSKL